MIHPNYFFPNSIWFFLYFRTEELKKKQAQQAQEISMARWKISCANDSEFES